MRKIASLVFGVVLMVSCHHGDTTRREDSNEIEDTAKVEASRKAVTAPMPSQDSYIPAIPKKSPNVCDTLKPKGGQNMIIAYSISPKKLEILDDKTKMYVVETTTDFGAYYNQLVKDLPSGTESLNTTACYISLGDTVLDTAKDKFGIILIKADGTRKIIPGVRPTDEWTDMVSHFFKVNN